MSAQLFTRAVEEGAPVDVLEGGGRRGLDRGCVVLFVEAGSAGQCAEGGERVLHAGGGAVDTNCVCCALVWLPAFIY